MSWSPVKYHSNSGPTLSSSSATNPSTDTTACITTLPTLPSSRRICSRTLTTTGLDTHRSSDGDPVLDVHDRPRLPLAVLGARVPIPAGTAPGRLPLRDSEGILITGHAWRR